MPVERKDVIASLRRKGFDREENDHIFFLFRHTGRKTAVVTKVSRGKGHRTIGDELVSRMARQLRLSKEEFVELVDCRLERADLEERYRSLGIL